MSFLTVCGSDGNEHQFKRNDFLKGKRFTWYLLKSFLAFVYLVKKFICKIFLYSRLLYCCENRTVMIWDQYWKSEIINIQICYRFKGKQHTVVAHWTIFLPLRPRNLFKRHFRTNKNKCKSRISHKNRLSPETMLYDYSKSDTKQKQAEQFFQNQPICGSIIDDLAQTCKIWSFKISSMIPLKGG